MKPRTASFLLGLRVLGFLNMYSKADTGFINAETQLHYTLFSNYCKDALPSRDKKTAIISEFHFTNLNSFNSRKQVVTITGWFNFIWTDGRLSWKMDAYANIPYIFAKQADVWKPDLIPEKDAGQVTTLGLDEQYTKINSSGVVEWSPSGVFNLPCQLDLTRFPFDTQTCNFFVTSWTHTSDELILIHNTSVGLDVYIENEEWKLVDCTLLPYNTYGIYVGFKVALQLQRKPHFYILVLIFPAILSSVLNSLVFLLPPVSGERITLSITSFLTFTIFISYLRDMVPQNADNIPLVAVLLVLQSGLSIISLCCNVLVVRMDCRKSRSLNGSFHGVKYKRIPSVREKPCRKGDFVRNLVDSPENSKDKITDNGINGLSMGTVSSGVITGTQRIDNMMCLGFFVISLLLFVVFTAIIAYP